MSPILFILIIKMLSVMIKRATTKNLIVDFKIVVDAYDINHLTPCALKNGSSPQGIVSIIKVLHVIP